MTKPDRLPAWRQYTGYALVTGLCVWSIRCLYAIHAARQAATAAAEVSSSAGETLGAGTGLAVAVTLTAIFWAAVSGPTLVLWYFVRKPPRV